jgi:hypothetical protein
MPGRNDRRKLLLSIASPLYAPLYLAKAANLDSIFQHIDFEYRFTRDKSYKGDPLVRDVLSRTDDWDCMAAVCDPYRALIKNATDDHMMDAPLIVGCLIQHMCYWLIDAQNPDSEAGENGIAGAFDQIIVAQRHTTNYAVAMDHLINGCKVPDVNTADSVLYSYPASGYEERFYRRFNGAFKLAYMTMNPLSLFAREKKGTIWKPFLQDKRYQNTFMTGVVVGRAYCEKHPQRIEGLRHGIASAIEMINRDPLLAAERLQSYRDDYISFSADDVDFRKLAKVLEYLAEMEAYPMEGRISADAMDRGAEVRASARPVNPHKDNLMEPSKIKECVQPGIVKAECKRKKQPAPKVVHEDWIKTLAVSTLSARSAPGESDTGLPFGLLASSVLLAASFCLMSVDRWTQLGPVASLIGRVHLNAPGTAADLGGYFAVLSVVCAVPEWLRYLSGPRLSMLRTFVLNVTSIAAAIIVVDAFVDKNFVFETFLTLAFGAGGWWVKYHLPDFRRGGEYIKRLWHNLRSELVVWTAARPSRRISQ